MTMMQSFARGRRRHPAYAAEGALPAPVAPVAPPVNMNDRTSLVATQGEQMNKAMNYDASAHINKYAQGAWGSISDRIGTQLRDLSGKAVGQGRFDSGFYDEDQGDVMLAGMRDFNNTMAQTSMEAERMRLGEVREGRDMLMSRREEMENNAREEAERKRKKKRGIAGMIGGALGAAGGAMFGQPGIGYAIGSRIGG